MVRKGRRDIHGILLVNKPEGLTSAAVVAIIKRQFKLYKVGHAGTLDPIATGVLPICINEGTKLAGLLSDNGKSYRTEMKLGVETDTQDRTGQIVAETDVTAGESEVREVLESFIGKFDQLPPMFSAKKKDGQPLYKKARLGQEVERKAVPVEIKEMEIHKIEIPLVGVSVTVSKGFYIRTLCHDVGHKLLCGASMEKLVRTGHGNFKLEDTVDLADVETMDIESLKEKIIPLNSQDIDIPMLIVDQEVALDLSYGRSITKAQAMEHCRFDENSPANLFRAIDLNGEILALVRARTDLAGIKSLRDTDFAFAIERGFSLK